MLPDIYFDKNFGKLYEEIENAKATVFEFKSSSGKIIHQFMMREIPDIEGYYDIVTPYGYGGPLITECTGDRSVLAEEFAEAFRKYCDENKIVSEFVRFHPIVNNQADFRNIYETIYMHNTVGTDIANHADPVQEEFSKSCRKTIRQVLKKGIICRITEAPENLNTFIPIYYDTMDRDKASDYYYFPKSYFETCLKYYHENILLAEAFYEDKVIAAGFYFSYNGIIQAHLSGTLNEYLHLSPAYILKYETALYAKEHGISVIHYGGGTSNSENDPLYIFKKKFTKGTEFGFYIGKKIWNEKIYNELCEKKNVNRDTVEYFPQYRAK